MVTQFDKVKSTNLPTNSKESSSSRFGDMDKFKFLYSSWRGVQNE